MAIYIVVDASVAGAWLFNEKYTAKATKVLAAIEAHRVIALAPDRFTEEVLRICQKKTQPTPSSGVTVAPIDAWERFLEVVTSPIQFLPSVELHEQAWHLAVATGLTTHDALYLALAERWGADLWTLDARLGELPPATYRSVRDLRGTLFPH